VAVQAMPWHVALVVAKSRALTVEQQKLLMFNISTKKTTCKRKELLIFGRLDWNLDQKNDTSRIANQTIVNELRELHSPRQGLVILTNFALLSYWGSI
jgi:hypothetical protein